MKLGVGDGDAVSLESGLVIKQILCTASHLSPVGFVGSQVPSWYFYSVMKLRFQIRYLGLEILLDG